MLSKEQRHGIISLNIQEKPTIEVFYEPLPEPGDGSETFKILLLVVGVLLIIVAALLMGRHSVVS